MSISTRIVIGVIIVAALALLGWLASQGSPGALLGGLAAVFGAYKGKLFGSSSEEIREEHRAKREEWEVIRQKYASELQALRARMDYLNYRTMRIDAELRTLDDDEREVIRKIEEMSSEEKIDELGRVLRDLGGSVTHG